MHNYRTDKTIRKIIAILRGITPGEAIDIAAVIADAGISMIEVPLNSPDPFTSITRLSGHFGPEVIIGAGTVCHTDQVEALRRAGGQLVVSPNCNLDVIAATKAAGMLSYPGVFTPTECFAALGAGADGLKLFPARVFGPPGLKDLRAVLDPDTEIYVVGGAGPENMADWIKAGASGFGIGSAIYKPGDSVEAVARKSAIIVVAYDKETQSYDANSF